ncbi:MAG: peptidoglycan-binding domain-containing protein [Rhodobacteraceae bacterium]|nr:peptidoglycan-binding domain-containing protein [Paracoccaceae bacterium]
MHHGNENGAVSFCILRDRRETGLNEPVKPMLVVLATLCVPVMTVAQSSPSPYAEKTEASMGLDRAQRRGIQFRLRALGFNPDSPDGLFGPRTRQAIGRWQSSRGEPATGYLDANTPRTLLETGTAADIMSEVLSTAESITDTFRCVLALSAIAGVQAETGDISGAGRSISEALSTARSVTDADDRSGAGKSRRGEGEGRRHVKGPKHHEGKPSPDAASRRAAASGGGVRRLKHGTVLRTCQHDDRFPLPERGGRGGRAG